MSKIAKTTTTQESKSAQVAVKKPATKSAKNKSSIKKEAASSARSVKIVQPSTVWPFELDYVEDWAYFKGAFTPEECGKIIEIGNARIVDNSRIRGNDVAPNIRDSKNSWLMPCDDSHWIFRRVTDVIVDLNSKFFKFDLYGFVLRFVSCNLDITNVSLSK